MTTQDLQQTADGVTSSVNKHVDEQATSLTNSVKQFVDTAYRNGKDNTFDNLSQKLEGQQARIDAMTADKTEAERMASADHSLLEQLKQHFAQTMLIIKTNTDTEAKLIKQMQKSIKIDGSELVKAIESESGKSINQILNQKVVKYINTAVRSVENNRQAVEHSNQQVITVMRKATVWLTILLLSIGLLVVVPGWQLRLIIVGIGVVGGGIYGGFKTFLG